MLHFLINQADLNLLVELTSPRDTVRNLLKPTESGQATNIEDLSGILIKTTHSIMHFIEKKFPTLQTINKLVKISGNFGL